MRQVFGIVHIRASQEAVCQRGSRKAQVTGSNPVVGSTNARGSRKGPSFRVWGARVAERFAFEVCDAPFGRFLVGAELSLRATSSCCKPDLLAGHISQQPQFVASSESSTLNRKRRRCATVFAERLQAQKYASASRAKKGVERLLAPFSLRLALRPTTLPAFRT